MDELLAQVSEQTGIPVDMLDRAARARASASGTTPEAVLAGWAGAPVPEAAAAVAQAQEPVAAAEPLPVPAPADDSGGLGVEVLEPEPPAPGDGEEPAIEALPEPETVAVGPGLPRWLTAAFVVVPFFAILYALSVPNGPDCGSAGRLEIDPATGLAVNCDGSEYGSVEVDFFTLGQSLYAANCSICHGVSGGGNPAPALAGGSVLSTFSSCDDHVQWVTGGSAGWPDSTYGDTNKTVGGGMPQFGTNPAFPTVDEIRAVVLFERVAFGGADLAETETACGLVPAEAVALGG